MIKFRSFTFDAKKQTYKHKDFSANQTAEASYQRALKRVGQVAGKLIDTHLEPDGITIRNHPELNRQLKAYSDALGPWAEKQASKMLDAVLKKNKKAFKQRSSLMGSELKLHLAETETLQAAQLKMFENVTLIKSIPLDAAERTQALALKAVIEGTRANPSKELIDQIKEQLGVSTEYAVNRAKLIAVTETARANASITEARAKGIGAHGYIWRTTMDGAERHAHAKMNGKYVPYDKEPTLEDGTKGHAGTFPRCRCWQDPQWE